MILILGNLDIENGEHTQFEFNISFRACIISFSMDFTVNKLLMFYFKPNAHGTF